MNANVLIVQLIRKHALSPDDIHVTERATYEIWHHGLTKYEVCDAIVMWIDDGKAVEQDKTTNNSKHMGETIYIFNPVKINEKDYYVKVSFSKNHQSFCMYLVSAHD